MPYGLESSLHRILWLSSEYLLLATGTSQIDAIATQKFFHEEIPHSVFSRGASLVSRRALAPVVEADDARLRFYWTIVILCPFCPSKTGASALRLRRRLSQDAWNHFLSFNFLSDRRSDKKLNDKNEQPAGRQVRDEPDIIGRRARDETQRETSPPD